MPGQVSAASETLRRYHDLKAVVQSKLERWTELARRIEEIESRDV